MKLPSLFSTLLLFLLLSLPISASTPPIYLTADVQNPILFDITTYAGSTPVIIANIQTNGGAYTLLGSGWSAQLNYSKNDYASYIKTITGTVDAATGIATFTCVSNTFPASGDWLGEVYLYNGDQKLTCAQGIIRVKKSPSSGAIGSLNLMNRFNWDIIESIGTTPWSDFDTNNLQSQITANLASANATSVVFEAFRERIVSNETFRITTQPATNLSLQTQITNNKTAQDNTNSGYEGRIASNETFRTVTQPATNAAIQTQITLNLTNQNITNLTFQTQITDNLTNQNATNSNLQTQITQHLTNQTATNINLQNQITANFTNQTNTNIVFNLRIGSNETFRITTQPATNAALQNQITANLTNQNATNLSLQAQINSVSTNANMGLYRYDACPSVPNTIWVLATSTNVAGLRAGSIFTFTIPSGTRLLSSKIRVDGGNTDSGSIYLILGTNDMNNSSTVNNWIPVCNATRDDTYANIPVTAQTYSGDNTQIKISGLGAIGGITYHVESRY
jgi:hypothetical protein